MSSINSLPSFTKALTAFCLVLLVYLFLPDSLSSLSQILKYLLIIGIIILLMMSNKALGQIASPQESVPASKSSVGNDSYSIESNTTTNLYENLKKLVLSTTTALNPSFKSAIYIIDPENNVFSLQESNGEEFKDSIPINNSIINSVLQKTNTVYQKDDVLAWDDLFGSKPWRGSECIIGSSINMHGTVAGFVLTRIDHFSDIADRDKPVLNSLGKFITYGLESLESLEKHINGEENKARILDLLSNLNFKSDETQILNHFKFLIRTFFNYDILTLSLSENDDTSSIIKIRDGLKDEFEKDTKFPTNGTLHGLPTINGETILTQNWKDSHPNISRFRSSETETESQSVLGVPVMIDGECNGSLFLERVSGRPYTTADQKNLELIGRVLGNSLHWLYEYEKIYRDATHDGLSNLLNHQTFKDQFSEEIQRAKRFQHNMAVLMFDLDKFKRINDSLGHPYGDYVIQTVAKIMVKNVRTIDVVARYGGEEFAIILINTTAEMGLVVAQRIVDNIADYPFSMNGETVQMTISGGMSEYPTHSEDSKNLIDLADKAMYASKQNGGNGIIIYNNENHVVEEKHEN
jgi:diguanylate cyclase (GGDEF)-like protein